jgi:flap endonuclease-1
MGIKGLFKFIKKYAPSAITEINESNLKNKTIAFDTSILIYQFVIAIRNQGKDLQNSQGMITSHIHAIIMKTLSFLKKKINPVYVFDGKPPTIKYDTLKERVKTRQQAIENLEKNVELDEETKIKLLKQSVVITGKQMEECKEILRLIGIPVINAEQEADSQCALLSKKGKVDAIASEDMDLLTFGTETLIRNINGKKAIEIKLSKILNECNINYDQFIDLCILMGCDYCPTIEGIGMHTAFKLIKKHDNIENIINDDLIRKKIYISDEFKSKYMIAREYFKNPPINDNYGEICWEAPKFDELKQLLMKKYSYSEITVNKLLVKPLYGGHYSNLFGKNYDQLQNQITVEREFESYFTNLKINVDNIEYDFDDQFLDDDEKALEQIFDMENINIQNLLIKKNTNEIEM